jgi:hypothetical protein
MVIFYFVLVISWKKAFFSFFSGASGTFLLNPPAFNAGGEIAK